MSDTKEALKIALEALKTCDPGESGGFTYEGTYPSYDKRSVENAIAAIEAVLSPPSVTVNVQSEQIDRKFLVDNLSLLADAAKTETAIAAFGEEWASGLARDALRLLDEYDNVLRGLAFWLSAGGFNSEGLIDPEMADEKIRWGIDHVCDVERKRAALPPAVQVPQWISVEERLPEPKIPVLAAGPMYNDAANGYWQEVLFWDGGKWCIWCIDDDAGTSWEGYSPTHWMPLPPSPTSQGGDNG